MKTIEQLYRGFYLNSESANSQISNCQNPLRVAPIKKVNNYENLEIDYEHFAFAEKNENWKLEYFHGLKNFLRVEKSDFPPIFIFDNHNHAITFRYNIIYTKKIKNAELIHIDQHSDCWKNKNHLELNWNENELEKVFEFWNEKCNVWNFILPAIELWLINTVEQINTEYKLLNFQTDKNNIILDVDLDFRAPEMGIEKHLKTIEKIKELISKSNIVTIATSPYFLDQKVAISIIDGLLKYSK